jgi:dipeptidyl aminopeptidase/acylaminoacyl peptidase
VGCWRWFIQMRGEYVLSNAFVRCVIACCLIEFVGGYGNGQGVVRPIPIEEALGLQYFPEHALLSLSPGGDYVAYTLVSQSRLPGTLVTQSGVPGVDGDLFDSKGVPPHGRGRRVWVTDVKSGSPRALLGASANSWAPSWSSDGRYLAFYSDSGGHAALWLWEKATGNLRQASDVVVRAVGGFEVPQWTPDGSGVVIPVLHEGMSLNGAVGRGGTEQAAERVGGESPSRVEVYTSKEVETRVGGAPRSSAYICDLVLIDVRSGTQRAIVKGCNSTRYYVSPDGRYVAWVNLDGSKRVSSGWPLFDIAVASIDGSTPRLVAEGVRMVGNPSFSWSPDSGRISYTTSWVDGKEGDCYVATVDGSGPINLTPGKHARFGTLDTVPLWDASGRGVYCVDGEGSAWFVSANGGKAVELTRGLGREVLGLIERRSGTVWSPDGGRSIVVCTRDAGSKQEGFYRIDSNTGENFKLNEGTWSLAPESVVSDGVDVSRDGGEIAYISEDGQHCGDVWVTGPDFVKRRRLTNVNPSMDAFVMGETRLIEWRTEDGELVRGALLLPAGYRKGQLYPMIVEVYGGASWSGHANEFGLGGFGVSNWQLFATRGFAVFMPDIPVHVGTPMRDIAKAVLPGVDKLVDLGIADPKRIGVTGKSYGGYTTLALIVQSRRFKAAFVRSAVGSDLFSVYGVLAKRFGRGRNITWTEEGQGRMGGTPWDRRDKYIENSPFFYLDRVETPLMMVQGAQDHTIPDYLQEQTFVALKRLGKEVVYVVYAHGGHSEPSLNREDSIDYFNRMVGWFTEKLGVDGGTR